MWDLYCSDQDVELFTIDCNGSSGLWLDGREGDSLTAVGPACWLEH